MERDAIAMFKKLGLFLKVPPLNTNQDRLNFMARKCRDGKMLCDLLVKLDHGCFSRNQIRYNKNQQNLKMSEFSCAQNISWFLMVLDREFMIKETFAVSDLYNYNNLQSVLNVLAKISQHPKAIEKGVKSFTLSNEDDELYSTMSSKVQEMEIEVYPPADTSIRLTQSVTYSYDDNSEDIYGMLCGDELSQPVPANTNNNRGYRNDQQDNFDGQSSFNEDEIYGTQPSTTRDFIIQEIIDIDAKYIKQLKVIIESFKQPLISILPAPSIKRIFQNIQDLYETHIELHAMLQKIGEQRTERRIISKPFKAYKDRFAMYAQYLLGLEDAEAEIEKVRQTNSQAAQLLQDGRQHVEFNFELNELLKLPMQHILRYPLTVKRLAEKSGESHRDYRDLMEVLTDLEDLNKYINETKKDILSTINPVRNLQELIRKSPSVHIDAGELETYGCMLLDEMLTKWKNGENKEYKQSLTQRIRMVVFTTFTLTLSMKGNIIERVIFSCPIWEMGHITEVQTKTSLFGNKSYYIEISPNRGPRQQVYVPNEAKARKLQRTLIEAKKKYTAGFDQSGICHYKISDVPQVTGVLPQCARVKCRKLFHGVRMQGYQCVHKPRIFVHYECLQAVMGGEEVVEVPELPKRSKSRNSLQHTSPRVQQQQRPFSTTGSSFRSNSQFDFTVPLRPDPREKPNPSVTDEMPTPLPRFDHPPAARPPPSAILDNNIYSIDPNEFRTVHGEDRQKIENMIYYDADISRQQAAQVLEFGGKHSFLIRARKGAGDCTNAPFALTIKGREQVYHAKINYSSAEDRYYLASSKRFGSVDEMIRFYQNPGNDLHTAFPALHGSLGQSIYKSKGTIRRNGWQRCRIIQEWAASAKWTVKLVDGSHSIHSTTCMEDVRPENIQV